MDIRLKNVESMETMRGVAYNAQLYVDDGVHILDFENRGDGSATYLYWESGDDVDELREQLEEYVEALPPRNYQGLELPFNMEMFLEALFNVHILKNKIRRSILFRTADGDIRVAKGYNYRTQPEITERLLKQFPGALILTREMIHEQPYKAWKNFTV